jgi:hypothetical protein
MKFLKYLLLLVFANTSLIVKSQDNKTDLNDSIQTDEIITDSIIRDNNSLNILNAETDNAFTNYNKLSDILPPSPNAASLGKYGGINIGLSSGVISHTIQVYEYKSRKLTLPISLTYSSSGFKVDEIASRVGTGWSLNAGGVITRTVYGNVDEYTTRLNCPVIAYTLEFLEFMNNLADKTFSRPTNDALPDIFSFNFNGNYGTFILIPKSTTGGVIEWEPQLLTHSGLKIIKSGLGFLVSTSDGTRYFFDDIETSSSYQSGQQNCIGRTYDVINPTAWYLSKIIHPNNDTVTFEYTTVHISEKISLSHTLQKKDNGLSAFPCYPSIDPGYSDMWCVNNLINSSKVLKEINSTTGGKVKFFYSSRRDCSDSILKKIEIYKPNTSAPYKKLLLRYTTVSGSGSHESDATLSYRPFLSSVVEKDKNSTDSLKYTFEYTDLNNLPARLSLAQDHWGYYNGKNNTTLIPMPGSAYLINKFPEATANREPDSINVQKGILKTITYPTGGRDIIDYESNKIYKQVTIYQNPVNICATGTVTDPSLKTSIFYSDIATIQFNQPGVIITGSCTLNSGNLYFCSATFELINASTGSTIQTLKTITAGENFTIGYDLQAGINYKLKINLYSQIGYAGGELSVNAFFTYTPGTPVITNKNVITGGVRVKRVTTYDPVSNVSSIKRYYYSKTDSTSASSGTNISYPQYYRLYESYMVCPGTCSLVSLDMHSMYSKSIDYGLSSPTYYSNVFESSGEHFENGGIEHRYIVAPEESASSYWGEWFMGSPNTSNSYKNGKEIYTWKWKK